MLSSEKSSASTGPKERSGVYQIACFRGKSLPGDCGGPLHTILVCRFMLPKSELSGSQKGRINGEAKRGKGVREGTRPEGEIAGKNERKRVGGKRPESTLKKL